MLLTAAAFYYVVLSVPRSLAAGPEKTRAAYLRERKEVIYENLRDLNFEFKAGKFPESDYLTMKSSLEDEAAAVLSELERLESAMQAPPAIRSKKGQTI
jgi:hypothetical protein